MISVENRRWTRCLRSSLPRYDNRKATWRSTASEHRLSKLMFRQEPVQHQGARITVRLLSVSVLRKGCSGYQPQFRCLGCGGRRENPQKAHVGDWSLSTKRVADSCHSLQGFTPVRPRKHRRNCDSAGQILSLSQRFCFDRRDFEATQRNLGPTARFCACSADLLSAVWVLTLASGF